MKIQFTQPHTDDFGKSYQPGWVADWSQPDAERAIAAGFAKPAPLDAFCRKYAAPALISSECVSTGQSITLNELTEQRPQAVPKTARLRL